MGVVACPESSIFFGRKWTSLFAAGLLEERAPVWESRPNLGGEVRLCVGIVLFVGVGKVRPEAREISVSMRHHI
jgi:hypothetical protein